MLDSLWNLFAWNKSLGLIQQENLCTYIGLFIVDEMRNKLCWIEGG